MAKSKLPKLPIFNTIGRAEQNNVLQALRQPLSGYLGGEGRSKGKFVTKLEDEWAAKFAVKHAIACNSATSGLLAACAAADVAWDSSVLTSPYTMSATAACAAFLGAHVGFVDIEPWRYSIDPNLLPPHVTRKMKAVIVPNMFGHAAQLHKIKGWCKQHGVVMIEDNAQSPLAHENGLYAGTIGDMGVFSLNVHKHIQAGEGGVIVTNDDVHASRLRAIVNHGELDKGPVGLNLRMTETTAAIACAQLEKAEKVIQTRIDLAHRLSEMFGAAYWIRPQQEDDGCNHVYYLWTARVSELTAYPLVQRLTERGFPMRVGYSRLLPPIFGSLAECPVAKKVEDSLISFEVCAYDPTYAHLERMKRVAKEVIAEFEYGDLETKIRAA